MKLPRVLTVLTGIALLVAAIGCSTTPVEVAPTPNIDATVEARVKQEVAAQPAVEPVVVVKEVPIEVIKEVIKEVPVEVIKEVVVTGTPVPTYTPLPTLTPAVVIVEVEVIKEVVVTVTPVPTLLPTVKPSSTRITGKDLQNEFTFNVLAATKKYKGRLISIEGPVKRVERYGKYEAVANLRGTPVALLGFGNIVCFISEEEALALTAGSQVTMSAEYLQKDGDRMRFLFHPCSVVSTP